MQGHRYFPLTPDGVVEAYEWLIRTDNYRNFRKRYSDKITAYMVVSYCNYKKYHSKD